MAPRKVYVLTVKLRCDNISSNNPPMAYNLLTENDLADALSDSESYMRGFYQGIPELQRLTRGKPGKIPKGKPRVTDGTLAAIRRETPKQIIQQLPNGRVTIYKDEEMEDQANAVLTDLIIPNANSGGTPYSKAKRGIKSTIDVGSAWAYCFFNETNGLLHADYKLKYYRDVLFEKGKVSEFDCNFMPMVEWLTEGDIKWIIYRESQRKVTKTDWDLKALQELLDKGPTDKDEQAKSPEEKKANADNGYFKLVYFFQKGVGATFYCYAPTIKKCVRTWQTKDPRGIIPLHGLVPEDDDDNPLGEPLAAISAGKQNLLDFDMQMYQYGQALLYSPPVKKWGNTPSSKVKLIPDNVIEMDGNPATDDFKAVDMTNSATSNFNNNYGLIKTQIQSEMGRRSDTSVSSGAGNPEFSKTPAGVAQSQQVTDISNNDLLVSYELWQGRIWETCLNIHFAESEGKKEVQLQRSTLQRLKLDKNPTIDYDKEYGPIDYCVTAFTSKKLSDAEQVANMALVDSLMTPQNAWQLAQIGWKLDIGEFQKAKLTRMNIDSIDKFLSKMDDKEAAAAKQMPFPIIDAPQLRMNSADLSPEQIQAILSQQAGVQVQPVQPPNGAPAGLSAQGQADFAVEMTKAQGEAAAKAAAAQQPAEGKAATPAKPLGEIIQWKPGDLTENERTQALAQVGIVADEGGASMNPNAQAAAIDGATKLDKHVHDTTLALDKHITAAAQPQPTDPNNPQAQAVPTATHTEPNDTENAAEAVGEPANV